MQRIIEFLTFNILKINIYSSRFAYVRKKKMIPLSAIHRLEDLKFLKEFGLPAIKIASIDLNYFQLHEKIIKYKMPTIISTGMGLEKEIKDIVSFYKKNRNPNIVLLHCNSLYPPKEPQVNFAHIIPKAIPKKPKKPATLV